jgi:hypothetical protein
MCLLPATTRNPDGDAVMFEFSVDRLEPPIITLRHASVWPATANPLRGSGALGVADVVSTATEVRVAGVTRPRLVPHPHTCVPAATPALHPTGRPTTTER